MPYEHIIYEPGAVARIILNRPQVRNAQSQQMIWEMDEAFREAGPDRDVMVVVLSGAGESFSAGLIRALNAARDRADNLGVLAVA